MLSDDEARSLLQRAGETVPVDPTRQIADPPRRPVWPILVAAAAVVAVALTSVLLVNRDGGDRDPDPAPATPDTAQVPSVLGFERAEATGALEDAGFVVTITPVSTWCLPVETAVGTDPAAGTRLDPGSAIELRVSADADGTCVDDSGALAYELLAFADGRGKPPPLANSIQIYDDSRASEITATQATDPETWRACSKDEVCTSVLSALSTAAHSFYPAPAGNQTRYMSPTLAASTEDQPCQYGTDPAPERASVRVAVVTSASDPECAESVLDVYRDARGRVDLVALRTLGSTPEPPHHHEPDVAHRLRDFARGDGELPPLADEVDLYLGNAFTGFVTQQSATDRAAWATCTETGSYFGISCPLSPLDVLEGHRQVDYVDAPQGRCMPTYGPLPPDLRRADRVTIVPAEGSIDTCLRNFAVQVFTNDDGELIAVSLLLGEP